MRLLPVRASYPHQCLLQENAKQETAYPTPPHPPTTGDSSIYSSITPLWTDRQGRQYWCECQIADRHLINLINSLIQAKLLLQSRHQPDELERDPRLQAVMAELKQELKTFVAVAQRRHLGPELCAFAPFLH